MARDGRTLRRTPGLTFGRLLGTGKGTTFTLGSSDFRHWAIVASWQSATAAAAFEQSRADAVLEPDRRRAPPGPAAAADRTRPLGRPGAVRVAAPPSGRRAGRQHHPGPAGGRPAADVLAGRAASGPRPRPGRRGPAGHRHRRGAGRLPGHLLDLDVSRGRHRVRPPSAPPTRSPSGAPRRSGGTPRSSSPGSRCSTSRAATPAGTREPVSTVSAVDTRPGRTLRVPLALTAVTVLAQIAYPLAPDDWLGRLSVLTVLAFAAASTTHAVAARGWAWAARLLLVVVPGAFAAEVVGVGTGFPFGHYDYSHRLGPVAGRRAAAGPTRLADDGLPVPPAGPRCWSADRIASDWSISLSSKGFSPSERSPGVALAAWDVFLDPQMVAAHNWTWRHPSPGLPGVASVPLTNLAGWLLVAVTLMTARRGGPVARRRPGGRAAARSRRTGRAAHLDLGRVDGRQRGLLRPAGGGRLGWPVARRLRRAVPARGAWAMGRLSRAAGPLTLAGTLAATALTAHTAVNLRRLRRPSPHPTPLAEWVSVLLPVRDEAGRVGADAAGAAGCPRPVRRPRRAGGARRRFHRRHRRRRTPRGRATTRAFGWWPAGPCPRAGSASRMRVTSWPTRPTRRAPSSCSSTPTCGWPPTPSLQRWTCCGTAVWTSSAPTPGSWPRRRANGSCNPCCSGPGSPPSPFDEPSARVGHRCRPAMVSSSSSTEPPTGAPVVTPPSRTRCSTTSPSCARSRQRVAPAAWSTAPIWPPAGCTTGGAELRDGYAKSLWSAFGSPGGRRRRDRVCSGWPTSCRRPRRSCGGPRSGWPATPPRSLGRMLVGRRTRARVWPDALAHPVSIGALGWLTALSWRRHRRGELTWKGRALP